MEPLYELNFFLHEKIQSSIHLLSTKYQQLKTLFLYSIDRNRNYLAFKIRKKLIEQNIFILFIFKFLIC
jgi:hypothetical protein